MKVSHELVKKVTVCSAVQCADTKF